MIRFVLKRRDFAGHGHDATAPKTLTWLVVAVLAWVMLAMAATQATARDVRVDGPSALLAALSVAQSGDRLLLAPGEYGLLKLSPKEAADPRFDGPVTLTSADPARPAVFTGLRVTKGRNMIFDRLVFDYRAAPGGFKERPFRINNSQDITIRRSVFDGDNANGAGPAADGYGAGYALGVRKSDRVLIENNRFDNFYRGLTMGSGDGHIVRGNEITGMRSDGMNFVKVTNLLIEDNLIHSFRRNLDAGDHADMIQFWTFKAKTPTTDVTIRGNVLNMGSGDHTQSIFMRNEAVDSQGGGEAMFYRNLVIEENVIINGHLHGITVGATDGLVIRNNTLIRVPRRGAAAAKHGRGPAHWSPRIKVADASRNVVVENNISTGIGQMQPGWQVGRNLVIQDTGLMLPAHYNRVFVNGLMGPPYDLAGFRYLPNTALVPPGMGASRLAGH